MDVIKKTIEQQEEIIGLQSEVINLLEGKQKSVKEPTIKSGSIAVTAIIKNEQKMLPKMLKSCGDLPVLIVDTGSTDKSMELYKKHGVEWTKYSKFDTCKGTSETFSFSEARNEVKEFAKGYDWHIILDGDEYLKPGFEKDVLKLIKVKSDNIALSVEVETDVEKLMHPRVIKNIPEIKWESIIHNKMPYLEANRPLVYQSSLGIRSKYSPNHHIDPDRTIRMLRRSITESPNVARNYYYLSRELLPRKEIYESIYLLEKYIRIATPTNELADAHYLLSVCYIDTKDFDKAYDHAYECVKGIPSTQKAWQIISQFTHPEFKNMMQMIVDLADNRHTLTVRK